jgi:hypothetical protein
MAADSVRSPRSAPRRSRTSVSGSATTRAPAPTTCTRSTVRCPALPPSTLCTRIWPPVTDPASGRSRYVQCTLLQKGTPNSRRSSRLLSSRRPTTSAARTSSSSLSRASSSLCPTASTRRLARRSSLPSVLPLSSKRVSLSGVRSGWAGTIRVSRGYACFAKEAH